MTTEKHFLPVEANEIPLWHLKAGGHGSVGDTITREKERQRDADETRMLTALDGKNKEIRRLLTIIESAGIA